MLVLTDAPESTGKLVPRGEWTRRCQEELSDRDRELWAVLGHAGDPWCLDLAPLSSHSSWSTAADFWSRLVLITHAPDSQFDALGNLLRSSNPIEDPVAAVALTGEKFHGHRGRRWEVGQGNLYLSVALSPQQPAARLGMVFSMLAAVAAVDAIARSTGGAVPVGIKWVNDILAEGRKVGGVLAMSHARGGTVESVVLGMGLNVASCPRVESTVFVPEADCLNEIEGGGGVTLERLLPEVLGALAMRYRTVLAAGPDSIFEEYRRHSLVIGRQVRIWAEDTATGPESKWRAPLAAGTVKEMLPDLSLIVGDDPEPVIRGRLAFEEVCRSRGL